MTTVQNFIEGIAGEPQPLLANTSGTLLFEVHDPDRTDRWLVHVDKGMVSIAPAPADATADSTVRGERPLMNGIVEGRANAMTALLRGDIIVEGDPALLTSFQRIFPGPTGTTTHDPRQP